MAIGNSDDPLSLSEASTSFRIKAGHTIYLRGGTYTGDFTVTLNGTAESPITVNVYPGEVALIDGNLVVNGSYTKWLCDHRLIVHYTGWTARETAIEGSVPADMPCSQTVTVKGPGVVFAQAVLHDSAGVGFETTATNAMMQGNIIYHHGWLGPDRGHGHGLYGQNADPYKTVQNNLIFNNFGWGIHCYGDAGLVNNFTLLRNTCFGAGLLASASYNNILLGGETPLAGAELRGNCTYGAGGMVYYSRDGSTDVIETDNYWPDGMTARSAVTYTEQSGNVTEAPESGAVARLNVDIYDADIAYLTVYNWDDADSVTVDVSAVFDPADTLTLWAVQAGVNAAGAQQDVTEYTVAAGGTIAVDMTAATHGTVATPYQWTAPATTFPTFGAFVVKRTS